MQLATYILNQNGFHNSFFMPVRIKYVHYDFKYFTMTTILTIVVSSSEIGDKLLV